MKQIIDNLKLSDNHRELRSVSTMQKYIISGNKQYINFSSNDYLGLSDIELQNKFLESINFDTHFYLGTPSSRLMTGNVQSYDILENTIAKSLGKPKALVLSSGYMVNSGALAALTQPEDLIIADKLIHASIIDGLRLSKCKWTRFRHNDIEHLKQILEQNHLIHKNIYVVTESIFSMDGDVAKLAEIVELKRQYGFKIYLDEAHAFGVRGNGGLGVAQEVGLLDEVDYFVATMGKAIASQGAFIACDETSYDVLINRMRTVIYSTALPEISLLWSNFIITQLPLFKHKREHLIELSTELSTLLNMAVNNFSPIIPIKLGCNSVTVTMSKMLIERGYWVTAIRYPTVPKGSERLRVSLNANLSLDDIRGFGKVMNELLGDNRK